MDECQKWLLGLSSRAHLLIGLEDVKGNGLHLFRFLKAAGFNLNYVPAVLTDRERKHSVHHEKSDYLDALRVGKVILTKIEETLPASNILTQESDSLRELDLLLQEREELVREQTALKNQLHVLLHQHYGNSYKRGCRDIFSTINLNWYRSDLKESKASNLAPGIIRRLDRLMLTSLQIKEIDQTIKQTDKTIPEVKALTTQVKGCGNLTACKIVVEVGTIQRFSSKEKLAKYAGIAPVRYQSSSSKRVYTNSGGNRKLNQAIHTIALSQIGKYGLDQAKIYYDKKTKEGKSKLWALRCLKRHICNRVYVVLKNSNTN